jgi:transcriptional regulator
LYVPEIYKNENQEEILEFLHKNGFAILVNQVNGKLWATHIPLVLQIDESGQKFLIGHVSKDNPQSNSFDDSNEVLAIFSGSHAYISSSWYDHENVPTWNYIAVHVYGKIKILNTEQSKEALSQLVDKYEINSKKRVKVADLSEETMKQVHGIVAFKIEISKIEAVKKMSQNRDDKNYHQIIQNLGNQSDVSSKEMAKEMKENRN